jgi:hypothetical protein
VNPAHLEALPPTSLAQLVAQLAGITSATACVAAIEAGGISSRNWTDWTEQELRFALQPQKAFQDNAEQLTAVVAALLQLSDAASSYRLLLPFRQMGLVDFLDLKPVFSLNFEQREFAAEWSYVSGGHAAPDHVGICQELCTSRMTDPIAIEAIRYAAALAGHLMALLCRQLQLDVQRDDSFRMGLFNPGDDNPFDNSWENLAVAAGGKLCQAINKIRSRAHTKAVAVCHLTPAQTRLCFFPRKQVLRHVL